MHFSFSVEVCSATQQRAACNGFLENPYEVFMTFAATTLLRNSQSVKFIFFIAAIRFGIGIRSKPAPRTAPKASSPSTSSLLFWDPAQLGSSIDVPSEDPSR